MNKTFKIFVVIALLIIILLLFGVVFADKFLDKNNNDTNNVEEKNVLVEAINSEEILPYLAIIESDYKINGEVTEEIITKSIKEYLYSTKPRNSNSEYSYVISKEHINNIVEEYFKKEFKSTYVEELGLVEDGDDYIYEVLPTGTSSKYALFKSRTIDANKKEVKYDIYCNWIDKAGTSEELDVVSGTVTINLIYDEDIKGYVIDTVNYESIKDESTGSCFTG